MKRVALIDLGSNSVRLAIFERTSRYAFYVAQEHKVKVRLGQGAYENADGFLQDEAIKRCFAAFEDFKNIIDKFKVRKVLCIGTSAIRDAKNASTFINSVKKNFKINIKIISGKQEAFYGGFAALNLLSDFKDGVTVDIGGGSTELALIRNNQIIDMLSLDLGTVRLKELFYDKKDIKGIASFIKKELDKIPESFRSENIIGIGGSLRALTKTIMKLQNYPFDALHNFIYNYKDYSKLIDKISTSSVLELKEYPIKKERLDTIRGGAYIFKSLAKKLQAEKVITSGVGIREGLFLANLFSLKAKGDNLFAKKAFPANFNPSLRSLQDRFLTEESLVAYYAKAIFQATKELHNIDDKYLFDLTCAAKLANIGRVLGFYKKHMNSAYISVLGLNYGFTHEERILIFLLLRLKGRKYTSDENYESHKELLPPPKTIEFLSFILELSKIFDEYLFKKLKFRYEKQSLFVQGYKENIIIKDALKKLYKPVSLAIVFE